MSKKLLPIILGIILIAFSVFIGYKYVNPSVTYTDPSADLKYKQKGKHFEYITEGKKIEFNLVDPEQAPADIRDQVLLGYNIMNFTKKFAPKYSGDALNCSQCHFSGGNTLGGTNGGITLVGAPNWYPSFSKRRGKVLSLTERINDCFERSMSGTEAPEDSTEMKALIAYMEWISSPTKAIKDAPWRGLPVLKSKHVADAKNGALVYDKYCSSCHGADGQGNVKYPPLWGPEAFNSGAGMNRLETIAAFVYANMPYESPMLSEEQALDVGAYVIAQSRPQFL